MFENGQLLFLLITNGIILLTTYGVVSGILKRDKVQLNEIIAAQDHIARSVFNLDTTLQLIVERLQKITRATGTVVELIESDEVYYRATSGILKQHHGYRMKIAGSLSGVCISQKEIIRCVDTEKDARVNREAAREVAIRSMVVAPLLYDGKVIGVLKVAADKPNVFRRKDELSVKLLSSLIGPAIMHQQDYEANKKLLAERSHMALHDGLTGLSNRILFMENLSRAVLRLARNKNTVALCYLDLDGFKKINDELGHLAGDMLLRQFAERLKASVRATDSVARLGGDEFTIVLENLNNPQADIIAIARKILLAMTQPFILGDVKRVVSTSIGIATTTSSNAYVEVLIKQADNELYKAKQNGKNQFSLAMGS